MPGRSLIFELTQETISRCITGGGRSVRLQDPDGTTWNLDIRRGQSGGVLVTAYDCQAWDVYVEGSAIGRGYDDDPGEAAGKAYRTRGLSMLPEGVEIKVVGPTSWVVFCMDGAIHKIEAEKFNEVVGRTTKWAQLRGAKRHEIDLVVRQIATTP